MLTESRRRFSVVGIKSGDKVADYVADAGYFTRLFANVVAPRVTFNAVSPPPSSSSSISLRAVAELQGYAVAHPNVTVTTAAALED